MATNWNCSASGRQEENNGKGYKMTEGIIQLDYLPFTKQIEAHNASEQYVLYGGAVGGGKSIWLVNEALRDCLFWAGNRVAIFRWELQSFMTTTYKTMEKYILGVDGLVTHHDKNLKAITLCNGSEIMYGGIKPSSTKTGEDVLAKLKSLEISACYIDEVTEVPKNFFDILRTRIGRWEGTNVRTGVVERPPKKMRLTCNPAPGWVKQEFIDQKLEQHRFVSAGLKDNPYLGPEYAQDLRRDLPQDYVDQLIDGRWDVITIFDAVIPMEWVVRARQNKDIRVGSPIVFGVDVARFGDDKTTVVRRRGMVVDVLLQTEQQDTMATANQANMLYTSHKPEVIRIDAVGVGAGTADRLEEMDVPVDSIESGGRPSNVARFVNLRAEMWWGVRELFEQNCIRILDGPYTDELANELSQPKYLITSDRRIQVESKEAMKKRGVKSPNLADAFVYAFRDAKDTGPIMMWA